MPYNVAHNFWPTVLSVVPLAQCVVCHLSVVCDVLYCGETVRASEKVSEGVNRNQGKKVHFWPTVLSVVPLARCVVCLSVCLSVTFCIVAKWYVLAKKCLKE